VSLLPTRVQTGALLSLTVGEDGTATGRLVNNVAFMWLRAQRIPLTWIRDCVYDEDKAQVSHTGLHPGRVTGAYHAALAIGLLVPEADVSKTESNWFAKVLSGEAAVSAGHECEGRRHEVGDELRAIGAVGPDGETRYSLHARILALVTGRLIVMAWKNAAWEAALDPGDVSDLPSTVTLTFKAKVGSQGRLYGSITSQDIAAALRDVENIAIDRRAIDLPDPIRALGTITVPVKVASKLESKITINVIDAASTTAVAE